jgi:hypothetical protein
MELQDARTWVAYGLFFEQDMRPPCEFEKPDALVEAGSAGRLMLLDPQDERSGTPPD